MDERVKIVSRKTLASGWGTLSESEFRLRRADGSWQTQRREIYDHGDAAAILLCDRTAGTVLLTRQFRFPAYDNGDSAWLVEVCAGLLDGDEPPACALREAEEETGHRPRDLRFVAKLYLSPGSLSERVSLFVGAYDASTRTGPGGGVADEGEDIEILELPFADALQMCRTGAIVDAKTVLLLHWAALNGVFETPDAPPG